VKVVVGFDHTNRENSLALTSTNEVMCWVVPGQAVKKHTYHQARTAKMGSETGIDAVFKTPVTFAEYESGIYSQVCAAVEARHREQDVHQAVGQIEEVEVANESVEDEAVNPRKLTPEQRIETRPNEEEYQALAMSTATNAV